MSGFADSRSELWLGPCLVPVPPCPCLPTEQSPEPMARALAQLGQPLELSVLHGKRMMPSLQDKLICELLA